MNPDLWLGAAGQHREEAQRALTISSAGSILVQSLINRVVQAITLRYLGVISTLDHRPGSGPAAYINRRTPGQTVGGGEWVADTGTATEEVGDYAQASFTYRTYLSQGKITRRLQATGRSYADTMALEIAMRLDDHVDGLENGLVQGNVAANAQQINGLLTVINAVSGQVVGNTTANVGAALRLAKLDEAIDLVRGQSADKVIYGSLKSTRLLNAALQAQQQFVNMTQIDAGFRVRAYDDIPIVKSTQLPDTLVFNATDVKVTAFTGGTSSALIVVNRRECWIEDLTPTSVLPLAKASSQYDTFDIFTDMALVFANTKAGCILAGLSG